MKKNIFISILFLCLSFSAFAERRVAVVIGNAFYTPIPLRNPVNDSKAIAQALRNLEFDVHEYADISLEEMKNAASLVDEMSEGDVFLFYYSGHGFQVNGANFLIPSGPLMATPLDAIEHAFNINYLLSKTAAKKTKNIVILDACRNVFTRSQVGGLTRLNAPTNSFIAFSTSPDKTASDGTGENSPFAESLLAEIEKSGQSIDEVFINVKKQVYSKTEGKQVPWTESSMLETFCFKDCENRGPVSTAITKREAYRTILNLSYDWFLSMTNSEVSSLVGFYQFPVNDYFGDKNISREEFVAQMRSYFAKWTTRRLDLQDLKITGSTEDFGRVSVELSYKFEFLSSENKKIKGTSKNNIVFSLIKNKFLITSISEKISN